MIETFDGFNHCLFSFLIKKIFYDLKTKPKQLEALQQNIQFRRRCLILLYLSKSRKNQPRRQVHYNQ